MPRRKNSAHKVTQGVQSWSYSLKGQPLGSTSPSSAHRVTFNIPEDNEISENFEGPTNFKRKKLFKILPLDGVILGEINFLIKEYERINFDLKESDFIVLWSENEGQLEVLLKISSNSDKSKLLVLALIVPDEKLRNVLIDLFRSQYIWTVSSVENLVQGKLSVNVSLTPAKTPIYKATNVIEFFYGETDKPFATETGRKISTKDFFKEVKNFQEGKLVLFEKDVQHEKLLPTLRPYQAKAVQWMLFREKKELETQTADWLSTLLETYKSKCGQNVYYNKYSGVLSLELCDFPPFPRGGILADEMGLGKTVAMISLVLNHCLDPLDDTGDFLSPHAQVDEKYIVRSSSSFDASPDEVIDQNKEDYLDADEKLINTKASGGHILKRALTEWYNSKLAAYCAASPAKVPRSSGSGIKCICGGNSSNTEEDCVQCPGCEQFQHIQCVGFQENCQYYCPPCWEKQKLVRSGATLIIAPASIYHQWFDEIKKHVELLAFKNGVFMYDGVRNRFIQPSVLAVKDIVITTYDVLRAEVNHIAENDSSRTLRNEKRFLKTFSPLCRVHWWRLCLDEAQMVEKDHSQLNRMVNLLSSVNRWSVTGTPVQKSVCDLFYLVEWLGIQPYNDKALWNNFLYIPFASGNRVPLHSVISRVFWRNSKEDVSGELEIPKQTVEYHFLKFTAIEQNFYMREHSVTSTLFAEGLQRFRLDLDKTIDSVDKSTLTKLLIPLLNLRQACSHPLAVKGNKIFSKTGNMTLSELLQYLSNKTKVECEEGMRKYVAALNGLAGLCCIEEDWCKAVEYYRQVLQFTEEYKGKVHIDALQRIHTMTNLVEILQVQSEKIPPTLRDDSLKSDAKALEDKYLQKAIDDLAADRNLLSEFSKKVTELKNNFESATDVWWNHLIHVYTIEGSIKELIDKIGTELVTSGVENRKKVELFLRKMLTGTELEIMLRNWLSAVEGNREKALKQLNNLLKAPQEDLVYRAVDCHLRTFEVDGARGRKCQLCLCESVLLDYECSLFDVSRKVLEGKHEKVLDGAQTKGSWRSQNAEKCLKVILSLSKQKSNCESWCLKDGKTHMQLLEVMKKEFKQLRAVWMSINHQVQACDEISMCKFRLRLRLRGEPIPPQVTSLSLKQYSKLETIHIIDLHEVEPLRLKLNNELEEAKSEFKKKYGTLLYLNNLGQKENSKPEPCPVCKMVLNNEWCVLSCGHSYCIDCIRIMLQRSPKAVINCPVCREVTKSSDLCFVDMSGRQDDSDITVLGDHSTKVEGVVRTLLELKSREPGVKVLVFSTWTVVLNILQVAFNQNNISCRRVPGNRYHLQLKEFRDPDANIDALLLPVSWGSKGLNLTEATHVFLVEPIMNPAEELQAIGRVHRIGQTRETVVHKFLIRGTIEEKIHAAVSEEKDKWGQKKVTLRDLESLFNIQNDLMTSASSDV